MGLQPDGKDENQMRRYPPRKRGPWLLRCTMDFRFRGNDVIFGSGARNDIALARAAQVINFLSSGSCRSLLEMTDSLAFR
jgi:hypothetical protein